jgi:hypothetical protein
LAHGGRDVARDGARGGRGCGLRHGDEDAFAVEYTISRGPRAADLAAWVEGQC